MLTLPPLGEVPPVGGGWGNSTFERLPVPLRRLRRHLPQRGRSFVSPRSKQLFPLWGKSRPKGGDGATQPLRGPPCPSGGFAATAPKGGGVLSPPGASNSSPFGGSPARRAGMGQLNL